MNMGQNQLLGTLLSVLLHVHPGGLYTQGVVHPGGCTPKGVVHPGVVHPGGLLSHMLTLAAVLFIMCFHGDQIWFLQQLSGERCYHPLWL